MAHMNLDKKATKPMPTRSSVVLGDLRSMPRIDAASRPKKKSCCQTSSVFTRDPKKIPTAVLKHRLLNKGTSGPLARNH